MNDRDRQAGLDWLRLALASQVVLIHVIGFHPFVAVYPVGAFVCISGYLIPASFARSRGWVHFAWKRFLRVFPVFLLSLLLVAVLEPSGLWPTLLGYLTLNILGAGNPNDALWSLMAEEILYTFHAATRRWYGVALALGGLVLSIAGAWWTTRYSYLPIVGGCFFAGNLLALTSWWRRPSLWWSVGLLAVVAAWQTWLTEREAIAEVGRLGLPILGAVALVTWAAKATLPRLRSDYSYSLYALHLPVLLLFPYARPIKLAAMLIIMPPLCAAVWRWIEAPALALKDAWPRPSAEARA